MASYESLLDLARNGDKVFLSAATTLLKFANEILENPTDSKKRCILVNSPEVSQLLTIEGGIDCLFSMGFEEGGEQFIYPMNKDLNSLRVFRNELYKKVALLPKISRNDIKLKSRPTNTGRNQFGFVDNKRYPTDIHELEKAFYSRLQAHCQDVTLLEDKNCQEEARRCMPLSELNDLAKVRFQAVKSNVVSNDGNFDLRDCLLLELLKWFKESFFRWVDRPECDFCGGESKPLDRAFVPTPEEVMWHVSRVEGYMCTVCGKEVRFPRHNHPLMLLKTRRGRCGEWAKCFTLCCLALNFEARLVLDWTDHVWTEVYSNSQNRWLHTDPCENICDQPLVYEIGWGKKLTYIIAFSAVEVLDVTWRYSATHKEVLGRRLLCREAWLLDTINRLNATRQASLPESMKKMLVQRLATELVEFLSPAKSTKDGELGGRTSGSLAWRLSRAEINPDQVKHEPFVFTPTAAETAAKVIHVKYSAVTDKYIRVSSSNQEIISWDSVVYESSNIIRKVETDWKMVYLARTEGSSSAFVSWQFDFNRSGLQVEEVKVVCKSSVFESGRIMWKLCCKDNCVLLPSDGSNFSTTELQGCKELQLRANLSQGNGSCAWQHTQLFRQSISSIDEFPLEVIIKLK